MQPMASIALRAARNAGQTITRALDRPDLTKVEEISAHHYVTNVARKAEGELVYALKQTYPAHGFITASSENQVDESESQDAVWIIDALNGSTNFVHSIPHFAISIACRMNGKIEHAVIVDPVRNEEFTASRGKGARLTTSASAPRKRKD